MAIGLNKGERSGAAARLATVATQTLPALPPIGTRITVSYPEKLSVGDVLRPMKSRYHQLLGVDSVAAPEPNAFVWADNWFALHSLLGEGLKVQLAYLDPPYATGADFESRGQEHAYHDVLGDATYIEYVRRRIILLRELLSDDGSIYVHIGHQMLAEVKLILDEVFGAKNFLNLITRRKCSSKNFTKNQFSNLNDYILFYSKSKSYIWNQPTQEPDPEWMAREYPKVDERGQYKLVPVHAPGVRRGETGLPWRGVFPPPGKHWQYTPSKLNELDAAGMIHWSKNGNPRRKVYLAYDKGISYTDYWDKFRDAHHQSVLVTGYPTEKNFEMLRMIVKASSNEGDLVIDPFCGSGTALHAADTLHRRWIGIDQSFVAAQTVVRRMTQGRKPMGDYVVRNKTAKPDLFGGWPQSASNQESPCSEISVYVDEHLNKEAVEEVDQLAKLLAFAIE